MNDREKSIAMLQTEVLKLALKASPGSRMRSHLCEAASWFPAIGSRDNGTQQDLHGGITRQEVAALLRCINAAREQGDDPKRMLRSMRNAFEKILDYYDLGAE